MTEQAKLLVEIDQRSKSNSHRLDSLEESVKGIHEMSVAVKMMGQNIQRLTEEIKEQGARVKTLEAIPAARWEIMIKTILTAVVSAGAGAILAQIFH